MSKVAEYESYKRIKLLGEGSFGKAFLVENVTNGLQYVLKQVDLSMMTENDKKLTLEEARILRSLNHPNIVRFHEVYKTKRGRLCIVMDYADGGDLSNKLKEARGKYIPENQIFDWFTQICLGMKHVHDRKILHRDLKAQNIFLTKTNMIKLGDFGIAKALRNTKENAKTMVGTPYYLSPEIVQGKDYNFKSDIWSLGVVLYELCALKPPFDADSLKGLAQKIARGQYNPIPSWYSTSMKDLISTLLQVDPNKRPTINNILNMSVMKGRIKSLMTETIRNIEFSHTILHKQNLLNPAIRLEDVKNVLNEVPLPMEMVQKLKQQDANIRQSDPNLVKPPMVLPAQNPKPLSNLNTPNNNNNVANPVLFRNNPSPARNQSPARNPIQQQTPQKKDEVPMYNFKNYQSKENQPQPVQQLVPNPVQKLTDIPRFDKNQPPVVSRANDPKQIIDNKVNNNGIINSNPRDLTPGRVPPAEGLRRQMSSNVPERDITPNRIPSVDGLRRQLSSNIPDRQPVSNIDNKADPNSINRCKPLSKEIETKPAFLGINPGNNNNSNDIKGKNPPDILPPRPMINIPRTPSKQDLFGKDNITPSSQRNAQVSTPTNRDERKGCNTPGRASREGQFNFANVAARDILGKSPLKRDNSSKGGLNNDSDNIFKERCSTPNDKMKHQIESDRKKQEDEKANKDKMMGYEQKKKEQEKMGQDVKDKLFRENDNKIEMRRDSSRSNLNKDEKEKPPINNGKLVIVSEAKKPNDYPFKVNGFGAGPGIPESKNSARPQKGEYDSNEPKKIVYRAPSSEDIKGTPNGVKNKVSCEFLPISKGNVGGNVESSSKPEKIPPAEQGQKHTERSGIEKKEENLMPYDMVSLYAFLGELRNADKRGDNEDDNGSTEVDNKVVVESLKEIEDDRDDNDDDDVNIKIPKRQMITKETPKEIIKEVKEIKEKVKDAVKKDNKTGENQNGGDIKKKTNSIEFYRLLLENELGPQNFRKAYSLLRDLVNKESLEPVKTKLTKNPDNGYLSAFIPPPVRDKCLPMIIKLVELEIEVKGAQKI